MRRLIPLVAGFGLGFAIVGATVAAAAFFVIGVGGHLLARSDDSAATTISFDPSTVAARSPVAAGVALFLFVLFIAIFVRLRRQERRYNVELGRLTKTPGEYPGVERRRSIGANGTH
ncbi:MAG: hypothetical protein IT336_16705 [Thermomicrobiales bacterium]|nr:hypothetical protein [Thermomicrobiales bacterium]